MTSLRGSTCNGVNKPVNCEVIRFAPLQDSPFINRICPNLLVLLCFRADANLHPLYFGSEKNKLARKQDVACS